MTCTRPIKLKDRNHYNGGLEVPCGKCRACRIARAREWATRIMHETNYHDHSTFITLTYNDENLPPTLSVDKSELQKFFKRLRKGIEGDGKKIKYFACGEYGEDKARPHYHAIIFGLPINFEWEQYWTKGFIKAGTVTYQSARYTADYIQKSVIGREADEAYKGREKPFQLVSKGLGASFALENAERLKKDLNTTIHGIDVGLPRYYKHILQKENVNYYVKREEIHLENWEPMDPETLIKSAKDRQKEIMDGWIKKGKIKYIDRLQGVELNREYTEKNLEARDELRRARDRSTKI